MAGENDKPTSRERFCCCCGASLGWLADREYERTDTCGSRQCDLEVRDMDRAEREDMHDRLDRDLGYGDY
jgi:anaerobic ribonucleoside-triphosphate reductase